MVYELTLKTATGTTTVRKILRGAMTPEEFERINTAYKGRVLGYNVIDVDPPVRKVAAKKGKKR